LLLLTDFTFRYRRREMRTQRNHLPLHDAKNAAERVEMAFPARGGALRSDHRAGERNISYKIAIMSTGAVSAYAGAHMTPCAFTVGISTSGSGQMQTLPMNELIKEQLEVVGF
jgi:peptide/nickel transport system substrate-binding protein